MSTKEKIKELLDETRSEDIVALVKEINSYDGSFDYVDVYDIEDLVEMMSDKREMVDVIYGKVDNIVDPVRFNGYGNLETVSEYELEKECEDDIDEIADWLIDNGTSDIYILHDEITDILQEQEEDMEV